MGNLLDKVKKIIAAVFLDIAASLFFWHLLSFLDNLFLRWLLGIGLGMAGLYANFILLQGLFSGNSDDDE
jgi:hypothetical protein